MFTSSTFAQDSIPNSGFEDWTNFGSYEDPDNWITENQATSLSGVVTATKATGSNAYSGNYAIRLETKQVVTEVVPGTAISGALNVMSLQLELGVPINIRPDNLCGWYKYIPFLADVGSIEIILTRYNPTTKLREPVGTGVYAVIAANSYTQFTVPIVYLSTDPTDLPDTALVSLISGTNTFTAGSVLYVDDICLTYTPPPVGIEPSENSAQFKFYPNPTSDILIFESTEATEVNLKLFDNTGRVVLQSRLLENSKSIDVSELSEGVYFYQLTNERHILQEGNITIAR